MCGINVVGGGGPALLLWKKWDKTLWHMAIRQDVTRGLNFLFLLGHNVDK